ncbi:MAG: hypothetical protein IGS50_15195 [Synechococcales cyanobacterium C42_A2020_086]|nr:hypothetical protein [Synechococcales cyanobacterium M58_A2018_015]MBF2075087.1 hypothetical protein [Synechococcales cyanobacterium C42_A2020_086]
MNSLRTSIQAWALKYLPLLPRLRQQRQASHLEKCWQISDTLKHHS